jgi:hypothetical protein
VVHTHGICTGAGTLATKATHTMKEHTDALNRTCMFVTRDAPCAASYMHHVNRGVWGPKAAPSLGTTCPTHLGGVFALRQAQPIAPAGSHHPKIVGADEDDHHLGLQGPKLAIHQPPQQVGGLVSCAPPTAVGVLHSITA